MSLRILVRKHRKSLAIVASVGLHVAIVMILIMPASGALSKLDLRALGEQDQTGIDVELINPSTDATELSRAETATDATQAFTDLTHPPAVDGWKAQAPQPSNTVSDVFGKELFSQTPKSAQTTRQSPKDSHVQVADRNSASVNDLWKAIAPCWRRLADKSTLGVTLNVSFSPLGNLAKPPVIIREPGAQLSTQRLRSESLAIAALSQCGPYLMSFGQENVGVQFPSGG